MQAELKDIPTSELMSELGERFRGDDYLSREFGNLYTEYGFITVTDNGCVWDPIERRIWGAKSEFAIFIFILLNWDNGHRIPYVAIQRLFGVSRMGRAVASVFESRSFVRIEKILKEKIFF